MKKKLIIILSAFIINCSSEPETFDELKQSGKVAYAREEYSDAKRLLQKAVKIKTSDRDVLYYLGLCYQNDYIYDSALFYFKKADLLFPEDRDLNMSIYHIAIKLQEWEYALKAINVLIKTGDPIKKYQQQIIELNLKIEQYYVAFINSRKLLESDLENKSNYIQAANLASQIDSMDYAMGTINKAIDKFGETEDLVLNKCIYLAKMKRYVEAEITMKNLIDISENPDYVKLNLANVLTSQDNRDKKLEGLRLYKEIQPRIGHVFKIDSTIIALEEELKISD